MTCADVNRSTADAVKCEMLFQVSDQLTNKYSKEYGKLCKSNQIGTVNDRVPHVYSQLLLKEAVTSNGHMFLGGYSRLAV